MLFLQILFNCVYSDIGSEFIKHAKDNLEGPHAKIISLVLLLIGACLCMFGMKYKTISLGVLCGLFTTQLAANLLKNMSDGVLFGLSLPDVVKDNAASLYKAMCDNMLIYWGVILILSLVLSWFLISFIHAITLIVILILIGISYTGGYHEKLFNYFGVQNEIVKYALLSIIFVILLLLYFKIPKIILILIFSISGSAMVTYGIDNLFNMEWNSLDMFTSTIHGKVDTPSTAMFIWLFTFAFSLGVQFISIFSLKMS